jgi:ABC-type dipeptide/oligopeptide/nickel transport system permease subunit
MAQETALGGFQGIEAEERREPGRIVSTLRALVRRRLALLALIYIALFYLCGLFAPLLAPYGYRAQNLDNATQPPSLSHPFGTDRAGRDLLSRVIYAARTTVIITMLTAITGGLVIGPALGLLAGYQRGWLDSLINRVGEVVSSLPDLLILITITATFGPRLNTWVANYYDLPLIGEPLRGGFASIFVLFLVLTLIGWVGSMRFIRAQTLQLREAEYVTAARALGAGTWRVIGSHILPNLSHLLVLGTAAAFGSVALAEIGLSFLGLGVRPPMPSFGEMIWSAASVRTLERQPHLFFFPASVAVLLFLSFNLLGDALNDVLNPRTRDR